MQSPRSYAGAVVARLRRARAGRNRDALNPEKRVLNRKLRMVFPPHFPERTVGLWHLVRYCKEAGLTGDIVECGVGRGASYFLIVFSMTSVSYPSRLYGFDSFRGFPEPSEWDDSPRRPRRGE